MTQFKITKVGTERTKQLEGGYTATYQTFAVTYGTETREIEASKGWTVEADGSIRWFLAHQFRAQLRTGNKAHRVGLTIEIKPDGSHVEYNTVVLNRQAQVTGFWQAAYDAPKGHGSKHNGTYKGLTVNQVEQLKAFGSDPVANYKSGIVTKVALRGLINRGLVEFVTVAGEPGYNVTVDGRQVKEGL